MRLKNNYCNLEDISEIFVSGIFKDFSEINNFLESYVKKIESKDKSNYLNEDDNFKLLKKTSFSIDDLVSLNYSFNLIDDDLINNYNLSKDISNLYYSFYFYKNNDSHLVGTKYDERIGMKIIVGKGYINEFYIDNYRNFILDKNGKQLVFKNNSKEALEDIINFGFDVKNKVSFLGDIIPKEKYNYYEDYFILNCKRENIKLI